MSAQIAAEPPIDARKSISVLIELRHFLRIDEGTPAILNGFVGGRD